MATRKEIIADKIQQLQNQLKTLEKQDKQTQRKTETKRKILMGALLQQWVKMGKVQETEVTKGLDKLLTRENERSLFGLAPLPKTSSPPTEANNNQKPANNNSTGRKSTATNQQEHIPSITQAATVVMAKSTKTASRLPEVDERKLENEFL
jgi:hypothetical protein